MSTHLNFLKYIDNLDQFLKTDPSLFPRGITPNFIKLSSSQVKDMLSRFRDLKLLSDAPSPIANYYPIDSTEQITRTLEYQLGHFYILSASSLIPALALGPKPAEKVLDLCSAPGGKSFLISQAMKNTGVLIANEPNAQRSIALKANIERMGLINTAVTQYRGQDFPDKSFDRILVDAPCSALGELKYKPEQLPKEGFADFVRQTQKKLIIRAFELLKVGGTLVYSTCTYPIQENEDIVESLLQRFPNARLVPLTFSFPFTKGFVGLENCLRIFPHQFRAGGFGVRAFDWNFTS